MASLIALGACSNTLPNRDPTGERFPTVTGQSLQAKAVTPPTDRGGAPAALLTGYEQKTQFDIDRWLLGLLQAEVDAQLLEVPTIPGLLPTIASGMIDEGMRSGIPEEDWCIVVTLYGSAAEPVAEFTGTTKGRLTRVLVLDSQGHVVWFDDSGYSASKVLAIMRLIDQLNSRRQ